MFLHIDYRSLIAIVLYPITHSGDMYDFRVTLDTPEDRLDYYYITVVRIYTGGSVYRTISHQTSTLSLSNDVVYNVSISAGPFMEFTSHFVIGMRSCTLNLESKLKTCFLSQGFTGLYNAEGLNNIPLK